MPPYDDSTTSRSPLPLLPEARLKLRVGRRALVVGRAQALLRFGRARDNDLIIDGEFTSRRHGEIVYRHGRFHLTDRSSNGTLLVRPGGRGMYFQGETLLLEGHGTIRCGHVEGKPIVFAVEIASRDGRTWSPEEIALDPLPAAANVVRREGEYWTLAYEGEVLRLKDAKGLRYLVRLMQSPGRELHALDLAAPDSSVDVDPPGAPSGSYETSHVDVGGGLGPVLDARARADYQRRIEELREEVSEADRCHDVGRAEAARAELEFLSEQLASAVGLGGRDRETGANAERARVAVTLRIKSTIQKIKNCHPALGAHLARTIKTGRYCSYEPAADDVVSWTFD